MTTTQEFKSGKPSKVMFGACLLVVMAAVFITPNNAALVCFHCLALALGIATHIGTEKLTLNFVSTDSSSGWSRFNSSLPFIMAVIVMYCCSIMVSARFHGVAQHSGVVFQFMEILKIVIVVTLMKGLTKTQESDDLADS